jgi:uncharacterized protein
MDRSMMSEDAARNRANYNFFAPIDLTNIAELDPVLLELVKTPAFQRLRSIRFLGAIDYLLVRSPNQARGNIRHTRFQHSVGVARLAMLYSAERELSFENRRLVSVAALLHDVGHAPLSHSLEPLFKEVFELEHHRATEDIVAGRVPLGREVYDVLRRHQVDVERVIHVISGNEMGFDGFFGGPINFDTIEGILRSQSYAAQHRNIPSPDVVMKAALRRSTEADREAVDNFWTYKNQVYQTLINSCSGVLADFACQLFMRKHLEKMTVDDYFLTEPQMFRKLGGLHQVLTNASFRFEICQHLDTSISYKKRRFFIDSTANFFERDDVRRYKQSKEENRLLFHRAHSRQRTELNQDLFDDEGNRASEATF